MHYDDADACDARNRWYIVDFTDREAEGDKCIETETADRPANWLTE